MRDSEYLRMAEDRTEKDQQYSNFREWYRKFREYGLGVRESVNMSLLQIYGDEV